MRKKKQTVNQTEVGEGLAKVWESLLSKSFFFFLLESGSFSFYTFFSFEMKNGFELFEF